MLLPGATSGDDIHSRIAHFVIPHSFLTRVEKYRDVHLPSAYSTHSHTPTQVPSPRGVDGAEERERERKRVKQEKASLSSRSREASQPNTPRTEVTPRASSSSPIPASFISPTSSCTSSSSLSQPISLPTIPTRDELEATSSPPRQQHTFTLGFVFEHYTTFNCASFLSACRPVNVLLFFQLFFSTCLLASLFSLPVIPYCETEIRLCFPFPRQAEGI